MALLLSGVLSGCGGNGRAAVPSPTALADNFLDHYVAPSGAVIRRDQGGDVVSEGEAYAMVLADIARRPQTVRTVWTWTRTHLQRSDGLLSWHAQADGSVLDAQSAGDADVLAAWALVNYHGPNAAAFVAAGKQLADAVLAHETANVGGHVVLVAGPWAITSPPAVTVNPSYLMPSVFRALGGVTHDQRWTSMAVTSVQLLAGLTHDGQQLPPDWAQVQGTALTPAGNPGTSGSPQYGPDAERSPVWLAVDCSQSAHQLAGRWWSHLRDQSQAMTRSLDGSVTDGTALPLADVAAAATADAAGKSAWAGGALDSAIRAAQDHPTYYGDAWVALGSTMLAGHGPACSR